MDNHSSIDFQLCENMDIVLVVSSTQVPNSLVVLVILKSIFLHRGSPIQLAEESLIQWHEQERLVTFSAASRSRCLSVFLCS